MDSINIVYAILVKHIGTAKNKRNLNVRQKRTQNNLEQKIWLNLKEIIYIHQNESYCKNSYDLLMKI